MKIRVIGSGAVGIGLGVLAIAQMDGYIQRLIQYAIPSAILPAWVAPAMAGIGIVFAVCGALLLVIPEALAERMMTSWRLSIVTYPEIPQELINRYMKQASERIWILDSWFSRTNVIPESDSKSSHGKHPKVCVLLLGKLGRDRFLEYRMKAVGLPKGAPYSEDALAMLARQCDRNGWELKVGTYDDYLPAFNMIVVDEHLFVGFYWFTKLSNHAPFLEIKDRQSPFYQECIDMFRQAHGNC